MDNDTEIYLRHDGDEDTSEKHNDSEVGEEGLDGADERGGDGESELIEGAGETIRINHEELEPEEIETTPPAKEDNPEGKTLEEITGNDAYYPLPTPEVGDMPPPAPPTSNEILDSANNEDNNAEPST